MEALAEVRFANFGVTPKRRGIRPSHVFPKIVLTRRSRGIRMKTETTTVRIGVLGVGPSNVGLFDIVRSILAEDFWRLLPGTGDW